MDRFHRFSVEFETLEVSPNTLITLSSPTSSSSPDCLVIFNFNTMLKGPLRDLQFISSTMNLHRMKFMSFAAEENVASLPFGDFMDVVKFSDLLNQQGSRLKRVAHVERAIDKDENSMITLWVDSDLVASRPDFETYLRKMPALENLATIQRPTGELHDFELFRIRIAENLDGAQRRALAEEQLWSLLTYLSTAHI